MTDFVEFLPRLKGKDVYFSLNKENPDWNESVGVELSFRHGGESLTLSLDDVDQSSYLASSLHHVLDGGNALISWCAKDVFSFLKGRTGIGLELKGKIYDLSVISSYLGMEADKPKTFREAVALLKSCLSDPGPCRCWSSGWELVVLTTCPEGTGGDCARGRWHRCKVSVPRQPTA